MHRCGAIRSVTPQFTPRMGEDMRMHDYVIVGAGSAGCLLAHRLAEDASTRVLLLEAGGARLDRYVDIPAAWPKLLRGRHDWRFFTEPQKDLLGRAIFIPRGKGLGGSSAINVQIYLRGDRADFDAWARLGNVGWGYDDVLPYFRRCEDNSRGAGPYHGAGGPIAVSDVRDPNPLTAVFVRACTEAGIPHNSDPNGAVLDGVANVQVTQRAGRRCSAAAPLLASGGRRPNLSIVTDAHVTRITFDGRRATGVEYVQDGRRVSVRAARETIVSAGTIGSPQLLMLSGIGAPDELRRHGIAVVHAAPGVGRDLVEHPLVCMHVRCPRPVTLATAESLRHLVHYLIRRRGPLSSNGVEAAAFVRTRSDLEAPDLELAFAVVLYQREWEDPPHEHGFTIGAVALQPLSRGFVILSSPDPFAAPVIQPRLISAAADLDVLVHGLHLARRIVAAPAFTDWQAGEITPGSERQSDDALREFIRETAHTIYHPVGTCRMGVDEAAVVDPQLRVRGVENLRVADASIMPTIPRGHTNAAAMMIGEKAADLLRAAD